MSKNLKKSSQGLKVTLATVAAKIHAHIIKKYWITLICMGGVQRKKPCCQNKKKEKITSRQV